MIRQIAVAASIALLGISGQAMAGQSVELSNVKGSVLVNQNGRYVPVTSTTALRAGDRVLAMNGDASLVYADGCKVNVSARSMSTIGSEACGADDVIRVADENNDGYEDSSQTTSNADLWLWIGFGVLTIVVTGAAIADDEDPTSV